MKFDALEIEKENALQLLRNPQIDFTNVPNLAVQTGNKTITQIMEEFDRAGRAILVANADQNFPETPGLRLYPDPIEALILEREINAELLIARKRLQEDQEEARKQLEKRAATNEAELARIKAIAKEVQLPKTEQMPTE
jgi:hypothetical protein